MTKHKTKAQQWTGLSSVEVEESRLKNGTNEIEKQKKDGILKKILKVLTEPMFLFLFVTASIYFLLGEVLDGVIMLCSVLFISGIEFLQGRKIDRALDELNALSALDVKVLRDNEEKMIDSRDVVVGDILFLEEGDTIPADGVILECQGLGVNESALTGESAVVYKKMKDDSAEHFKLNMCYSGCDVTNGTAVVRVTAVGGKTELGKIGRSLAEIKKEKTPLEKQIQQLIVICAIVSLVFCALVVLVNFLHNHDLAFGDRIAQAVLAGITLAMATIPEEIPVVLTVFLAMGAWRLAKHNTLTRNMKAVETLGAVTVFCTDKTGTLTQNRMAVKEVYFGEDERELARIAALASAKDPYDSMEIALQEYAFQNGYSKDLYDHELEHEYVFNNEDKMMGEVWMIGGKNLLAVKGAYENVLALCDLDSKMQREVEQQVEQYARKGYRVLAVAKNDNLKKIPEKLTDCGLEFVGLVALIDPPRAGVKESLDFCHRAGVRVIMITGDNGETAKGIARQIGMNASERVITGQELEKMSDEELEKRVEDTNIFARVYPSHKMRIVKALQKNGEVVAMTGDGVNDAPALKKAEIGIAMGERGTNVAKEAADMILLDDNFNTIVEAIKNGRTIYSNIQKAIMYILAIHIPIILLSLFIPLLNMPALLLPVHVVLLELIIDPTSSIIFQRLRPDREVVEGKPRRLNAPLLNWKMILRSIAQGVAIFVVVFASYFYLIHTGAEQTQAVAFAFATLILANVLVVYVLQSSDCAVKNFFMDFRDKIIVLINAIVVVVLLLLLYVPFLQKLVGTTALNLGEILFAFGLAIIATFSFDLLKIRKK